MKRYISTINRQGYVVIDNVFKKSQTNKFKKILESILIERANKKIDVGCDQNYLLYNYFLEDKKLLNLIFIKKINNILKKLIDADYVLQSTAAINRQKKSRNQKKKLLSKKIGVNWHTDSRYINKKRLDKGFGYLVIIALDPFTKNNGATKFVKGSANLRSIPPKNYKKNYNQLIMSEGSVCIMDNGMWHCAGEPSRNSRWSIFSNYSGWFVKPYFDFKDYLKKNKIKNCYRKMLHAYSLPPKPTSNRRHTLIKTNF